jgi:hypothetical protein
MRWPPYRSGLDITERVRGSAPFDGRHPSQAGTALTRKHSIGLAEVGDQERFRFVFAGQQPQQPQVFPGRLRSGVHVEKPLPVRRHISRRAVAFSAEQLFRWTPTVTRYPSSFTARGRSASATAMTAAVFFARGDVVAYA